MVTVKLNYFKIRLKHIKQDVIIERYHYQFFKQEFPDRCWCDTERMVLHLLNYNFHHEETLIGIFVTLFDAYIILNFVVSLNYTNTLLLEQAFFNAFVIVFNSSTWYLTSVNKMLMSLY